MPSISYARTLGDRIDAAQQMRRRYDAMNEAPSTEARREAQQVAAAGLRPDWLSPVYVDSMSDALCRAYHAHPERLYVLRGGVDAPKKNGASSSSAAGAAPAPVAAAATVVFQGGEGPFGYSIKEMMRAVEKMDETIRMQWKACVQ
jgi:hypothetical protein